MKVIAVDVPELGNRSHLVHDGEVALVVDPPRDVARVEQAAERAEVEIVAVADTHLHNDYVSGALALARRHGADYLLNADEDVDFERTGVRDGDVVEVGELPSRRSGPPGTRRTRRSSSQDGAGGLPALFSGAACSTARWGGPTWSTPA